LRKIDLNIILDEMLEECKTLYLNNKNIVIEAVKSRSGRIIADPERIKQVLRNLFTNAIKFSPPNGKIYVTLSEHEITYEDGIVVEALQFSITDQGIGVPNSELEIVFSPFIQSSKTKTQAGGTGLGLAIAKEIIIAHAGQIWANNDTNGNTVFNFLIPTNLSNQAEQYKVIVKSKAKQKVIPHHEVTILIIDDEEACLTSMDLLLHGSVFKLEKANCGYAGLNYLRANPYSIDIVLLDLMMPDIYGLKVLAEIKSDHALSNLPIVIQSGTSDDTEIERAYRLGIVGYIKKPYQKQVVMDMLYSIMQVDVLPPILQ
jgi:two-component system sensor histidine kinase ChiS